MIFVTVLFVVEWLCIACCHCILICWCKMIGRLCCQCIIHKWYLLVSQKALCHQRPPWLSWMGETVSQDKWPFFISNRYCIIGNHFLITKHASLTQEELCFLLEEGPDLTPTQICLVKRALVYLIVLSTITYQSWLYLVHIPVSIQWWLKTADCDVLLPRLRWLFRQTHQAMNTLNDRCLLSKLELSAVESGRLGGHIDESGMVIGLNKII